MINLFLSDNTSKADGRILEAMTKANEGYDMPYGNDDITQAFSEAVKAEFGEQAEAYPVLTGTGANVIALGCCLSPHESVICAETAHINVDECGAPERFTGSKLVTVKTEDGKLTPELILPHLTNLGFEHHSQPKVISISQVTETGCAYSEYELLQLSALAKKYGLYLHIDGSRVANAAAFLGTGLKEACLGADIISFGGTKNGLVIGEAVIFMNQDLLKNAKYVRKQFGQLCSKMRFVSAQLLTYIKDGIWHENASCANKMAAILAEGLLKKGVRIHYPVNSNAVFAKLSESRIKKLSETHGFYVWDETEGLCRFMCPYTTDEKDVALLLDSLE